jgi:hypothetical protein
MRNIRFWIPVIVGALLTPISLYSIYASANASEASGHAGTGMGAILLFYPLPMFFRILLQGTASGDAFVAQVISRLAFAMMVLQFPLYGFVISYAKLKRHRWLRLCAAVVWLHIIAIFAGVMVFLIQLAI